MSDNTGVEQTSEDDTAHLASETDGNELDAEELQARVELLAAENERLRDEYTRARQTQYRRSALALAGLGLLGIVGSILIVEQRRVLLALGATGLFGAALTYYLTPERFVPETVGERIHSAHTANQRALIDELGLQETRVYVPTPEHSNPARLFLPQRTDYEVPDSLDHVLAIASEPRERGMAVVPTGAPLYEEFTATVTGDPATEPAALAAQLADAVVEQFELATAVGYDRDLEADRVVFPVTDPVYGDLTVPDHPIGSLLGTGFALGLDTPVTVRVRDDDRVDARIVLAWSESDSQR